MFCPKCGAEVPTNSKFCQKCGYDLSAVVQNVTPQNEMDQSSADSDNNGQSENHSKPESVQNVNDYTKRNNSVNDHKDDRSPNSTVYLTLGWIAIFLSWFIFPIPFGIAGSVFGGILAQHDATKKSGTVLLIFGVVVIIIGFVELSMY